MRIITPQSEQNTLYRVNSYLKIYPNFSRLITFDCPPLVKQDGWELTKLVDSYQSTKPKKQQSDIKEALSSIESIRRTKTKITDIFLSNDFDLFCTFTFANDRYDIDSVKKRMYKWLSNQRDLRGRFNYLIIPEFHKDKKAIHFHGLLSNYKGNLLPSGRLTANRETIFNLESYQLGYTTAIKIDGNPKLGSYIKKYITKDMPQFSGKKRYWVSRDIIRPRKIVNPILTKDIYTQFCEVYRKNGLTVSQSELNLKTLSTIKGSL